MRLNNFGILMIVLGTAAVMSPPQPTQAAEPFPSSTIRILIGVPVGSAPDIVTRALAVEMQPLLGQAVIVENRPGAGGTIATAAVAAAAPDGYTLNVSGCSADAIVHGFVMSGRPALDPFKDFVPVGQLMRDHWVVLVSPVLNIGSLQQLAGLARDRSKALTYPSQGEGSSPHLQSERLARTLGFPALHVPYGDSPINDLVAGRLDFAVQSSSSSKAMVSAGKLKALAVLSAQRLPALAEVPTAAEQGLPGYTYNGGVCLWAPGRTPQPIVARLNGALSKALASPSVQSRFAALGVDATPLTTEETARFVAEFVGHVDELRKTVFGKSR